MVRLPVGVRAATPTRERAANHGSGLRECRRLLPPARTCSPLTAALRSTHCCTVPPARPPGPASSAARIPSPYPPPPALFSTTPCSSRCCCCCRGSLRGGVELQGGVRGGCAGADALRHDSDASGGPPAPLKLLRRRSAAHRRRLSASPGAAESCKASAHFFLDCAGACGEPVRSWKELSAGFPMI